MGKKKCDKNCPYRLLKVRCPFGVKETEKKETKEDELGHRLLGLR